MSYGFSATNNYNQILISSDTKNLHFIGKAYLYNTLLTSDYYGGVRQWTFRIGTAKNIAPLPFFSMTGNEYYGVSAVRQIDIGSNIIFTTNPITITGQLPKSYVWAEGPGNINEGSDNIYTIATTNVTTGTVMYWDLDAFPETYNDFKHANGSFTIGSDGKGSFVITPTKFFDPYPETTETHTVNIRANVALTGPIVLSYTFTVNNITSSDSIGFGWINGEGIAKGYFSENDLYNYDTINNRTFIVTSKEGNNSVIATSDIITISSDYTETYTFTTLPLTMNEGTAYSVVVSTTNVINGTVIYVTLNSTNKNDFIADDMTFTVQNNSGTFTITPTFFYDPYPEATLTTFTISLSKRYGQNDNSTIIPITTTNNPTIRIAGTSASISTGLGWQNNALWGTDPISEGVTGSGIPNDTGTTSSTVPTNTFIVTDIAPQNVVLDTSDVFTIVNSYLTITANPVISGGIFYLPTSADLTASGYTGGDLANYTSTYGNILLEGQSFTVNVSAGNQALTNGTVFYWDVQALGTGLPVKPMTVFTDGLASPEAITNDFSTRSGSIVIQNGAGSFTVPSVRVNEWAMKETKYEFFKINIRMGAELTGPVLKQIPFQILDQPFTADSLPIWGDPDNQSTRGIVASMNEGATSTFYLYNGLSGNNPNNNVNYYWTINHITTNNSDFLYGVSGQITTSKTNGTSGFTTYPTGMFSITTASDNLTEGLKRFSVSIRIGSITGTIVQTSGEIRLLDTSTTLNTAPSTISTTHSNLIIDEGSSTDVTVTFRYTHSTFFTKTKYFWRIDHITTNDLDFVKTNGIITTNVGTSSATFSIIIKAAATTDIEQIEYFTVSVVDIAAEQYRFWKINHVTTNANDFTTTSGVCIPGGYNWWYFYVNATADNLTENIGTEKFTLSITNISGTVLCTSGEIAITDASQGRAKPYIIGPAKVAEGVANTYSIFTTGLSDGTYYWRINDITTSTVQNYIPTSTGDFTTSWGEVNIVNNAATFSVTAASDGLTEYEEKYTISLVNKAAADKFWTIEHITTNNSDFGFPNGNCIPLGYNTWYFNIPVVADGLTEGTEKFNVQIRQGSATGTILTTSGAISILDTSLGAYSVIPSVAVEDINIDLIIFTPSITNGTTLYWDINHITTSDLDFVTTFGSFTASGSGAPITIKAIGYDALELDEGFTINVRTQPKYIWEIELIRSGTSNTVPEIYIFAEASASQLSLDETMGLKVLRDDGSTSFDSRLGPLVVTGGVVATSPSVAAPSWHGEAFFYDEDKGTGRFNPTNVAAPTAENAYNIPSMPAKPIFYYPSLAQHEKDVQYADTYTYYYGWYGWNSTYNEWRTNYWVFYRGGIRLSGNYIYAGWIGIAYGRHTEHTEGGSFIGIGNGNNGGITTGTWPYTNETLNLNSGVCLISDGALYD